MLELCGQPAQYHGVRAAILGRSAVVMSGFMVGRVAIPCALARSLIAAIKMAWVISPVSGKRRDRSGANLPVMTARSARLTTARAI